MNAIIFAFAAGAVGGLVLGVAIRSRRSDVAVSSAWRAMGKKVDRARRLLKLTRKAA